MKKENPYHDNSMWKGAHPEIFDVQRTYVTTQQRQKNFLGKIKKDPFKTYHFRRQHPIHFILLIFTRISLN